MTPETLASQYADMMMRAKTSIELALISGLIKKNLKDLVGYEDWLRDIWRSAHDNIMAPDCKPEDVLNKEGLRALKEGKL